MSRRRAGDPVHGWDRGRRCRWVRPDPGSCPRSPSARSRGPRRMTSRSNAASGSLCRVLQLVSGRDPRAPVGARGLIAQIGKRPSRSGPRSRRHARRIRRPCCRSSSGPSTLSAAMAAPVNSIAKLRLRRRPRWWRISAMTMSLALTRRHPDHHRRLDPHGLQPSIDQRLGRQIVLDIGGADAEAERPKSAIGRCGCRRRRPPCPAGSARSRVITTCSMPCRRCSISNNSMPKSRQFAAK